MRRGVRLAISVVSGLAAAVVAVMYVSSVQAEAQAAREQALAKYGEDLVAVCVATRDIAPGETLDEGNTEVREWVSSLLPDEPLTSLADASGRMVSSAVPRGSVVCEMHCKAMNEELDVPAGMVAVSIACDAEHGLGGELERGNQVDVYAARDSVAHRLATATVLDTSSLASGGGELAWVTLAMEPSAVSEVLSVAALAPVTLAMPSLVQEGEGEA